MKSVRLNEKSFKLWQKYGVKRIKTPEFELEFQDGLQVVEQPIDNSKIPTIPLNQMPTPDEVLFWSVDGGGGNPKDDKGPFEATA
jgi:hypothetical protein